MRALRPRKRPRSPGAATIPRSSAGRPLSRPRQRPSATRPTRVEAVTEEFIRGHLKAKCRAPRYIEETRRNFDLHVLTKWRGHTVKSVTRRDVATLLNGIADEGKPIAANRVLSAVRAIFNWALRQGLVDATPAALVERPGTETRRERVLT